jgi:hypothetical protein
MSWLIGYFVVLIIVLILNYFLQGPQHLEP